LQPISQRDHASVYSRAGAIFEWLHIGGLIAAMAGVLLRR